MILGNVVGGGGSLKTLIIEDSDGNQFPGVLTGEQVIFTADAATDIREGKTAATEAGIVVGEKVIPAYYAWQGVKVITNNSELKIQTPAYNYTKFQAIVCSFNTSLANSVAATKVAIENNLYMVQSTTIESTIIKNEETESIDFGIINDSGNNYIIRYFMYKEEY